MSTIEPLTTPAARLLALTRRWLTQSGELRARADRLGNCTAGRDAFIDACMLVKCAQDVHNALSADPAEEIREAPAKRASLTGEELAARIQAAGINAAPGLGGSVVLYATDIEAARILQFLEVHRPWHEGPDWTGWVRLDEVRDALAALNSRQERQA